MEAEGPTLSCFQEPKVQQDCGHLQSQRHPASSLDPPGASQEWLRSSTSKDLPSSLAGFFAKPWTSRCPSETDSFTCMMLALIPLAPPRHVTSSTREIFERFEEELETISPYHQQTQDWQESSSLCKKCVWAHLGLCQETNPVFLAEAIPVFIKALVCLFPAEA